jgi:protein-L-isoaspartate(D-aspartate) O-methyltransferase
MDSQLLHRSFYAEFVVAQTGSRDERVVNALARVDRQRYCGSGPWKVWTAAGYIETPSADPVFLYQDILVGLLPERAINNGEPSLHAQCLVSVQVQPQDRVVHVGVGSGYYTAILAELAGPEGMVRGYEIVPELAERARENLRDYPHVLVESCSGAEGALPSADVVYVSAGATEPMAAWLDALRPDGRLIFPLTPEVGMGGMLLVTRLRGADLEYDARFVSPAQFIPCLGARDSATGVRLAEAFRRGGQGEVRRLHRGSQPDGKKCWCFGHGWWLS